MLGVCSFFFLIFIHFYKAKTDEKERRMNIREKGLTDSEVISAREKFGSNVLAKVKGKGIVRRFFENLGDPIIKILLAALAIEVIFTFGNCNYVEVLGIVVAVLIATVVSTLSEYGSERAFAAIEAEIKERRVRVIRCGRDIEIEPDDIVVGDLLYLIRGEKIQADGRIIYGEVTVDQSALNGENREVIKRPGMAGEKGLLSTSEVFRGSLVTEGEGIMRVEKVGAATYYGMVARDVQSETRVSPLKLRLTRLASQISVLGYVAAALVGITYLFNALVVDAGFVPWRILEGVRDTRSLLGHLLHALTLMITVVVVAVPEGLPMMITVVLSANMKRMVKDNILVKKLVGIETAGSMNILFTDKTGTLTTGKLSVDRIVTNKGSTKSLSNLKSMGEIYSCLLLSAKYNTDCVVKGGELLGGNSTDRAIGEFFLSERSPVASIRSRTRFKSELKYSSVTLSDGRVLIKGAAEHILSRCRFSLSPGGEVYAGDLSDVRREYQSAVTKGERVIAVALGSASSEILTFVALIVLKDKIRAGVEKAVQNVLRAGIQIVMLTGDNKDTAVSIAEECGFFKRSAGHIALSSDELAAMSDSEIKELLPNIRVVSRALPQDKTRLVRISAESDLVVGMTGDGINDAPSLKAADVGFAMGSGTDIAKSAGDIVILDDSFESVSKTVLYGRTIFKSIRKFITFQLIMNLAACGITLIGGYLGVDNPITIIQMLWVNIIMDTLGGLAFAGEPPHGYYMLEKPKRRDEPILSRDMISHILLNGAFTLVLLALFLSADPVKRFYMNSSHHLTAFYALFIFAGLVNCFTARSERLSILSGITGNKAFIFIMSFITFIQLLIIYKGGTLFRSTPLTFAELRFAILLAFSVLVFDAFRRLFRKLG